MMFEVLGVSNPKLRVASVALFSPVSLESDSRLRQE